MSKLLEEENQKKTIIIETPPIAKKVTQKKEPPQKRLITSTKKWQEIDSNIRCSPDDIYQQKIIYEMVSMISSDCSGEPTNPTHKIIRQQIQQKIYGYKSQDSLKKWTAEGEHNDLDYDNTSSLNSAAISSYEGDEKQIPIDVDTVLLKMAECESRCFYCKRIVHVLYEFVREPRQWTLERLDNHFGHTRNNVVIACLQCNLRRRTMYHERYLFTKELSIKKI